MNKGISIAIIVLIAAAILPKQVLANNIDPEWHDPTTPLHQAPIKKSDNAPVVLALSAILEVGERKSAIINGSHVKAGDVVDRAKIVRIDSKSVVYMVDGKKYTLNMRPIFIN